MKTAGIIAEYNPFHKGHEYHISRTREITGADYCIVVMSGDFVQRGTPAVIDKYSRTRMALEGGADLVLELPVPFATASAQIFAHAGVTLLNRLGCVDSLCFGSESASLPLLSQIAVILNDEPEEYRSYLQEAVRSGKSYPRAVYEAVTHFLLVNIRESSSMIQEVNQIASQLASPNNILGIEYLRALQKTGSPICPFAIQRKGDSYHAQELSDELSSASAIRNWSEKASDIYGIRPYVPEKTFALLQQYFHHTFPVTEDDFSPVLNYVLTLSPHPETAADMTPELTDRIRKVLDQPRTFRELAEALKSKNITRARINRALLHTILGITKEDMNLYHAHDYCSYARILGFRESAAPLLHHIKQNSSIPIITKLADADSLLDDTGRNILSHEITASALYRQTVYHKFGELLPDEYRAGIILCAHNA